MENRPARRSVRYRLPGELHPSATVTLLAAPPGPPPALSSHGALARLAQAHPRQAERLHARMQRLMAREAEIFAWLEAAPQHVRLFFADPASALLAALPDLPPDFFTAAGGGDPAA